MTLPAGLFVLGALGFGCAESTAATPGTTTVTSAEAAQRDEIARLERERDEARALLKDEQSSREQERQRYSAEVSVLRQQDQLRLNVLDAVERADRDIQVLEGKIARAPAKQKKVIEQAITHAQDLKAKLNGHMRSLKGDVDKPFDSVRVEVESTIKDLDASLVSGIAATEAKPAEKKPMEKKAK